MVSTVHHCVQWHPLRATGTCWPITIVSVCWPVESIRFHVALCPCNNMWCWFLNYQQICICHCMISGLSSTNSITSLLIPAVERVENSNGIFHSPTLSVIQDATIQHIMWVEFPESKLKHWLFNVGAFALAMTGSLIHCQGKWVIYPDCICFTITTKESIETFCTLKV
jgi:hypothetical protein